VHRLVQARRLAELAAVDLDVEQVVELDTDHVSVAEPPVQLGALQVQQAGSVVVAGEARPCEHV
jgi:hypothetical protein